MRPARGVESGTVEQIGRWLDGPAWTQDTDARAMLPADALSDDLAADRPNLARAHACGLRPLPLGRASLLPLPAGTTDRCDQGVTAPPLTCTDVSRSGFAIRGRTER